MSILASDGKSLFQLQRNPSSDVAVLTNVTQNLPEVAFDEATNTYFKVALVKGQVKLTKMKPTPEMVVSWLRKYRKPQSCLELRQLVQKFFGDDLHEEDIHEVERMFTYSTPLPRHIGQR